MAPCDPLNHASSKKGVCFFVLGRVMPAFGSWPHDCKARPQLVESSCSLVKEMGFVFCFFFPSESFGDDAA